MPLADEEIRARVFSWLDAQVAIYGDQIPWKVLQSFELDGKPAALVTQRGIRWLTGMPALAFTTTYSADPAQAPYADHVGLDGLPRYKYQGTDPAKPDNVAMKRAGETGAALVWFVGTAEGVYTAVSPVFVGGSDDATLDRPGEVRGVVVLVVALVVVVVRYGYERSKGSTKDLRQPADRDGRG